MIPCVLAIDQAIANDEQSNLCAGGARDDNGSEVAGRVGDTPVHGRLGEVSHRANCRNVDIRLLGWMSQGLPPVHGGQKGRTGCIKNQTSQLK